MSVNYRTSNAATRAEFVEAAREVERVYRRKERLAGIWDATNPLALWRKVVKWWTCAEAIHRAYQLGHEHGWELGWAYAEDSHAMTFNAKNAAYTKRVTVERRVARERQTIG